MDHMLARTPDTMDLFKRLYRRAVGRFKAPHELAEDAAADAICSAIETGNLSHAYCAVSVRNYLYAYWRNRATRNEDYALPINEEGGPMETIHGATPASQYLRIEAIECVNALDSLPERIRPTMRYVAKDYSIDEIAEVLNLPKSEVVWHIKYGRKILRDRDGYEIERKRGHHQFIGIRKRHRIWEATFRRGEQEYYLGHFKTASEAAKAYDDKAKEILGDEAKLNFPNVITSVVGGSPPGS